MLNVSLILGEGANILSCPPLRMPMHGSLRAKNIVNINLIKRSTNCTIVHCRYVWTSLRLFPRISVSRFWLLFPHCDFPDLWIFRNIMISAVWTTLNKQLASEGRDQSLVFFEHWRPTHYHLSCFRHLLFIAYIEATGPREISSGVMAAAANGYIRTLALTFVGFQTEVSSGLAMVTD